MIQAPAKARSDVEVLVERFNQLAEERILDLSLAVGNPTLSGAFGTTAKDRIDEVEWAKMNIKRLAEEITSGNN